MDLATAIRKYLGRNVNFAPGPDNEVWLRDDGNGPYIYEWNITEKTKPTKSTIINAWNQSKLDYAKLKKTNILKHKKKLELLDFARIYTTIKNEYDTIKNQIDMANTEQEIEDIII